MKDDLFPVLDRDTQLFLASQFKSGYGDLELSKPLQESRGISRQAATAFLNRLVKAGVLVEGKKKKPKSYELVTKLVFKKSYPLAELEEHLVWEQDFSPVLKKYCSKESFSIWEYALTEMVNNAIDHSDGSKVEVRLLTSAIDALVFIDDDGEGIFRRIKRLCSLNDEHQAILELSKGKLTTDKTRHSGEGVFFTSRAVDWFCILSGGLRFTHSKDTDDMLVQLSVEDENKKVGTRVVLQQFFQTSKTLSKIFDEYAEPDEYSFSKTVVPVRLALMSSDNLVSRSQAQRVLARVERFKTVAFDFEGVETIGQAFADEIFRVFSKAHPDVKILSINENEQIESMIKRARAHS